MTVIRVLMSLMLCFVAGWSAAGAEDPYKRPPEQCAWRPVADEVYLQETGTQVASEEPLVAVAFYENTLFASTGETVYELDGDRLVQARNAPKGITRFRVLNGALWGLSDKGLYRYAGDKPEKVGEGAFVDACLVRGKVYAATEDDVYMFEDGKLTNIKPEAGFRSSELTFMMEDGTQVLMEPEKIGPVKRMACYSETLYVMRPDELVLLNGDRVDTRTIEWGLPPSSEFRDMIALGNELLIATNKGIAELRGSAMTTLNGEDGLPYEELTCFARGFNNDLWIGTSWGAIRRIGEREYHYFAGIRWLPDDTVHDIVVADKTVYIATDGGLGIIRYEPYTLLKKAAYYERRLAEWGHKRLGFVAPLRRSHGGPWLREATDNDGGNTAHYLTTMIYKYAVTGDPQDLAAAVDTMKSMVWLEEITEIPGFPARSIWPVENNGAVRDNIGSGGLPARWNLTPDGKFEWKGDTSSDEVGAHYYAMATFCSLAPDGPEKERAKEHINRLTRHIIESGWKLRDKGGQVTRWGRWDPDYLQKPYGMYARGLNGMEAQAFAATAVGLTGDAYFKEALQQLLDWGYHEYTVRQKITFPPEDITTWDDRLAFMSYYCLLKYTGTDWLNALYRRSLERSWEIKRMEKQPWFNFLYGIMTGNDCESAEAAQTLREWPLDLVIYNYANSQRTDLHPEEGYVPYARGPVTSSPKRISPRESEPTRLDETALALDGGSKGKLGTLCIIPTPWLESYWMGRYYGFIEAPATDDPALLRVEDTPLRTLGAEPYVGTPRPF